MNAIKYFRDKLQKLDRIDIQFLISCGLFFLMILYCLPSDSFHWDIFAFREWCIYAKLHGFRFLYNSGTDYMPLHHYFLYVFGKIPDTEHIVRYNEKYLKMIPFVFHMLNSGIVFLIVKKYYKRENWLFYSLFYLLNVAVLFNTVMWGQVDEIETFFLLTSILFGIRGKVVFSVTFYILAFYFKLQAGVFLPMILLVNYRNILELDLKKSIQLVIVFFGLQILIMFPFILSGHVGKIIDVVFNSFGRYPKVSMCAYNFWHFFFHYDANKVFDSGKFLFFTYNQWGYLMFFTMSAIVLFPWFIDTITRRFEFQLSKILLTCGVIVLVFFYFNTQMHERYSHPAIIFIILYCLIERKFLIGFLLCLAYLSNLHNVAKNEIHDIHSHFTIHDDIVISIMYLIVIVLGIRYLYEGFTINKNYHRVNDKN